VLKNSEEQYLLSTAICMWQLQHHYILRLNL